MSAVPELVTDRLLLRGFEPRDADAYAAMMADPEVTRFLGDGQPLDHVEAWRQMALIMGHWSLRGFGLWAVEERSTGALMGRVGCWEPAGWPGFEIGYALAKPFWGQGYATEAAQAALRYARDVLARDRIISIIRPDNAASIRVAERLGAASEGFITFHGAPSLVYAYQAGVPSAPRYYHGTRADLKPGDMISPGQRPNFGNLERVTTWVYLTATLDAATWGAELAIGEGAGRIYVVEPTGPIEDDPNLTDKKFPGNPTRSYRTRDALRVVGEVTEWEGHPPEVLQQMRDHLARLKEQGVEPIDD